MHIFFLVSLLQLVYGIRTVLVQGILPDFAIYYSYTKFFLSGENPYAFSEAFNYPPSTLLFLTPFSFLPFSLSEILFTILSLGFFLTTAWIFMGSAGIKRNGWKCIILAVLLQLFPTKFTLGMGQVNLYVLGAIFLIPYFEKKKNAMAVGIAWGIACMLKLIPFPLGIYFLLRKKWTSFIVGISLFSLINASFFLRYPISNYIIHQLPTLFVQTTTSSSPYDQSLRAFATRAGMENSFVLSIGIIAFLFVLSIYLYLRNKKKNQSHHDAFYSLLLALVTIGGSFAWQHHYVFLYPAIITLWSQFLKKKTSLLLWMLFIMSVILIGVHIPDPVHPPTNLIVVSHSFLGAFLLIFLLLRRLRT